LLCKTGLTCVLTVERAFGPNLRTGRANVRGGRSALRTLRSGLFPLRVRSQKALRTLVFLKYRSFVCVFQSFGKEQVSRALARQAQVRAGHFWPPPRSAARRAMRA
jgi:hypothetical protein